MIEGRWAQLTYASYDLGSGTAGGWQIKQASADLTEAEVEGIRSRIITSFEAVGELPKFPSPDEIGQLPRRLVYVPVENSAAYGYWHSAPAGVDGMGRPGNVFTHVLLDRHPDAPAPEFRPTDLWRSPGWLTPFGQPQVVAAEVANLSGQLPEGTLGRQSVVDFLLDPGVFRGSTFAVLLDAVAAALAGGPAVVIATASAETAALWLASVERLMAPRTSRRMGFSVFERASGLATVVRRGAVLIGVPYDDAELAAKAENTVVIDDRASHSLGDLGGKPHGVGSTTVPVTPWSVMAQVALQEPDLAIDVLEHIDGVANRFPEIALAPAWPLAMVVALLPDSLSDAAVEASQVLRDESPASLPEHADLWPAVARTAQHLFGTTTAEVAGQVAVLASSSSSVIRDLAISVYHDRVLADPAWILGASPAIAAKLARSNPDGSIGDRAIEVLRQTAASTDEPHERARRIVRVADWVVQSDLFGGNDAGLQVVLEPALHSLVVPLVLDPISGPGAVQAMGPGSETLMREWIRPLVDRNLVDQPGVLGQRVPSRVLAWLFPEPGVTFEDGLTELALEYIIDACDLGRPWAIPYRAKVWAAIVDRDAMESTRAKSVLRAEWPWSASEVLEAEALFPASLPPRVVRRALAAEPPGPDLDALIAEVHRTKANRAGGAIVLEVAALRMRAQKLSATHTMTASNDPAMSFDTLGTLLGTNDPLHLPSLALLVLTSTYAVGITGRPEFAITPARRAVLESCLDMVEPREFEACVRTLVATNFFGTRYFARAAQLAMFSAPDSPLEPHDETARTLATLTLASEDSDEPGLIVYVAVAMMEIGIDDIDVALKEAVTTALRGLPPGRDGQKAASEFEKFARAWSKNFKDLGRTKARTKPGLRSLFTNDKETS